MELLLGHLVGDYIFQTDWQATNKTSRHWPCLVHCLLYTLAVWLFNHEWMSWWALAICFGLHFPIDRWRLARFWMVRLSGQKAFATGPLAPWSIIVVDNILHLLTLWALWKLH